MRIKMTLEKITKSEIKEILAYPVKGEDLLNGL